MIKLIKRLLGIKPMRIDLRCERCADAESLLLHSTEKWQICGEYEDRNRTAGWVRLVTTE
jgi:hypothetical protein